jgi:hypothetical protein
MLEILGEIVDDPYNHKNVFMVVRAKDTLRLDALKLSITGIMNIGACGY